MQIKIEQIVNKIAEYERSIGGVKDSFDFARNPDVIHSAMLPCVLHYVPGYETDPTAHHNVWQMEWTVRSILLVKETTSQGGTLKFLENSALPYGNKWAEKFTDENVITDLFGAGGGGTVRAFLASAQYGAGGPLLTHSEMPYIGWVITFGFHKKQ